MEHNTHEDKGWVGLLLTILSWIGTGFAFAIEHYQFFTVPLSIAVSIYAIIYYRTATKAIKEKKDGK